MGLDPGRAPIKCYVALILSLGLEGVTFVAVMLVIMVVAQRQKREVYLQIKEESERGKK